MNKQQIRKVLNSLSPGDTLSINFAGDQTDSSGAFKVLKVKAGRGKGGSRLVELQAADGSLLTTGTPKSNQIVNMTTADGEIHGLESEQELRTFFEVDISRAVAFKEKFKTLEASTGDTVIEVESTEDSLNGKFAVMSTKQLRGRFGQIVLNLKNVANGELQELWSYRHSGVVTRITVL